MLVRLNISQALTLWPYIKTKLKVIVPPRFKDNPNRYANIFNVVAKGEMTVWVAMIPDDDNSENDRIYGFVLTEPVMDRHNQFWNLLIYGVYSIGNQVPEGLWLDGIHTLVDYANTKGYRYLSAFSNNRIVLAMMTKAGADVETRHCVINVKEAANGR